MLYLYRKEITDSGGAGKWRGGLSAESCFIPHGTDRIEQDTLSSGNAIPTSTGMMGGYPGAVNRYRFVRGSDVAERMRASDMPGDIDELEGTPETLQLRQQDFVQGPADVYAVLWSAAGGFGDPLERDPARVAADVENADVSPATALAVYGVVLSGEGAVDTNATRRKREAERRARLERGAKPAGAPRTLDGAVRFLATENLAVREVGRALHYACAGCATDLGPLGGNYKERCARDDRPIETSNPIVGDPRRFIDPLPQFRQFCCPGCGRLIENEIARADDPVLQDIELKIR